MHNVVPLWYPLLNQQYYRQVGGVAMGSRMGPNYACLFEGYMQERILPTYTAFIPQLDKQYIDNIVGAASCRRDELEGFIAHVSTFRFAVYSHHFSNPDTFPGHHTQHLG